MSRALRGDFERLRERGVSTTLAPRDDAVVPADTGVDPAPEQAPEVEEEPVAELWVPESPAVVPDPDPAITPDGDDVRTSSPGFLARLIGR
jgi:hypothetical protein